MNRRPSGLLLSKALVGFLQYKAAEGLSPSTLRGYEYNLSMWVSLTGPAKKPNSLLPNPISAGAVYSVICWCSLSTPNIRVRIYWPSKGSMPRGSFTASVLRAGLSLKSISGCRVMPGLGSSRHLPTLPSHTHGWQIPYHFSESRLCKLTVSRYLMPWYPLKAMGRRGRCHPPT